MQFDAALVESIRRLLHTDAETLPDATITDDLVGGRIIRLTLAEIGGAPYAERTPEEQARIRAAVAYRTAAALLGSGAMREGRTVTQERFGTQYSVSKNGQALDVDGWIATLRHDATIELAPLLPAQATDGLRHFRLAHGRRGA